MSPPLAMPVPGMGNDSIQVMLTPNFSNGAIVLASEPAWLGRRIMSVVLSRPVRSSARSAMTAKRVTLWGWSSMFSARTFEPVGAGGGAAGDGGGELLALGELGGGGGRDDLDLGRLRQVLAQPVAALRQGLRLGIDAADLAPLAAAEQAVMDAQPDLGADLQVRAA